MSLSIDCINSAREMRGLPPLVTSSTPTAIAPANDAPMPAVKRQQSAASLVERYRPRTLSEVVGQSEAVDVLREYAANPYPSAWLFAGPTGTGKTSAALALAADLGCRVEQNEFGGLHTLASGELTAGSVRALRDSLAFIPFYGSGWRVVVANEADQMSSAAEVVWLDVLESLPSRCCVVFSTNDVKGLSDRFRDRCESLIFTADVAKLKAPLGELLTRIWCAETGQAEAPLAKLTNVVRDGQVSIRRAVQELSKLIHRAAI